jgi:hypothetical protein
MICRCKVACSFNANDGKLHVVLRVPAIGSDEQRDFVSASHPVARVTNRANIQPQLS